MAKAKKLFDVRLRDGDPAFVIEDAKVSKWMGVPCLRGRLILRGSKWFGLGSIVSVPVSEIRNIYEFGSFEAFQAETQRLDDARAQDAVTPAPKPLRAPAGRRPKSR